MFNRDSAESTAPPLFTSPPSYAVLKIAAQKPQELDVASLPRARLSGHPFSIDHADILLVVEGSQVMNWFSNGNVKPILYYCFIHRLDSMVYEQFLTPLKLLQLGVMTTSQVMNWFSNGNVKLIRYYCFIHRLDSMVYEQFLTPLKILTVGGDDDAASTAEELSGTSATAKNAVEDLPKCVQAELALNLLLCQDLPAPSAQLARTGTIHSDLKSCSMEFRSFTFNTSSPNTASFAFLLTLCVLVAGFLLFGAYGSSTISF
ncbi:hypothetical protein F5887DRAFT_1091681 [Amanita rubescens]|nr:hypothetical protein F5887DRAFT_1091681 [Amanita rubescens]